MVTRGRAASQQVFGLGIVRPERLPGPSGGQWPMLRPSPIPLRVSSGFSPDSLTHGWVRLARGGP
jgi:hypothetical protein